jgi:hypothetical protein
MDTGPVLPDKPGISKRLSTANAETHDEKQGKGDQATLKEPVRT